MTIRRGDSIIAGNSADIPSQTGQSGKFLTTNGTTTSWGEVKQIEIAQDLSTPSADTVPSTKAVSDESSRITSIMNNYVKKSGDTMTGRLLLSNTDMGNESSSDTTYFIRRTNEDNTETPTESYIDAFREYDKNNKIIGDIRFVRTPTYQNTEIVARKNNADGTYVQSSIAAGITKDGIPVTTIPQSANITGSVTAINESFNYIARSPSIEKGITPTDSSKYVGYEFRDKNNDRLAWLGISYAASGAKNLQLQKQDDNLTNFTISYDTYVQRLFTLTGTNSINISRVDGSYTEVQTRKTDGTRTGGFRNINDATTNKNMTYVYVASDDGKSIAGIIGIGKIIGGDVYTECPTPTVSNNSNQIATTAYVNNKFQVVSALPASPDPNTYYFIPE